jgi:hypothetical protein
VSGRAGLQPVMGTSRFMIYQVPGARPILTGPAPSRVLALTESRVVLHVSRGGVYRLAVRYSPYWKASSGCVLEGKDHMVRLSLPGAGRVALSFSLDASRALHALEGAAPSCT